jgi:hypothetical protein
MSLGTQIITFFLITVGTSNICASIPPLTINFLLAALQQRSRYIFTCPSVARYVETVIDNVHITASNQPSALEHKPQFNTMHSKVK